MAKIARAETDKIEQNSHAIRPQVVSFRITQAQSTLLKDLFEKDSATGVNSPNQLARKLVCDYLAERLAYKKPSDKLQDFDFIGD